ncbi:MAG: circularly permuted type 2 ATP-grasp protein [Sphingomonadales bacterium]|nr:circularly permuted type 2 ATP-grasp protein [Sphingomonadales bacterium]MBD3774152.1 circularly permuted type 2 ATP-grasp protein [Paracoccaceae bacterium]
MADPAADLFGPDPASDPLAHYSPAEPQADVFRAAQGPIADAWRNLAAGLALQSQGDLAGLQHYIDRQVEDLGLAFRVAGDEEERPWPLNPMPLVISAAEWSGIEAGLAQRAELLERVIADIYGPQDLIRGGHLPAVVVSGSPHFARRMVGLEPPGGRHLNVCSFDLARGPDGEWRVLTDRVRLPVGIGYALENRLALMRSTGGLAGRLGARSHASFFEALRRGLAANCQRADPRLALLTPGRFNQSYPEQAYLARYMGLALVEGRDLAVRDGRLFVRTIAGLKRIDGLWRWINARDIDPLHFDARSRIGVPNLISACEQGLVLANWPGVGVVETRAMPAFLPRLARELLGEPLALPNVATWWCGGEAERKRVLDNFDKLVVSSAFKQQVAGLEDGRTRVGASMSPDERAAIMAGIARRPMDYTAQEIVHLSTTPALADGHFEARGFTLRAFLVRDGDGRWVAMPGGFARISKSGELRTSLMGLGDHSVDVWVIDPEPPESHAEAALPATAIRREEGLLPAQAADNLYWIGRYGERLNQTARAIRALVSHSAGVMARAEGVTATTRLANLLRRWNAAPPASIKWQPIRLAATALDERAQPGSVRQLTGMTHDLALLLRDRLTRDTWRAINRPFPSFDAEDADELVDACDLIVERQAAVARLASDGMSHTAGWRFLDLGMALERASLALQAVRELVPGKASGEDLSALLDLFDCLGLYRSRYLAIPTIAPVLDMVLLDPLQPRGFAYQLAVIDRHLAALPPLRDDGLPETAHLLARNLVASVEAQAAQEIVPATLDGWLGQLAGLSDAISRSYFLQQEGQDSKPPTSFLA